MGKWADYAITKVRYGEEENHIKEVRVREDLGDKLGQESVISRKKVVSWIHDNITFVTSYEKDRKWERGDDVGIVKVDGEEFIRTDGNHKKRDNLGALPEF